MNWWRVFLQFNYFTCRRKWWLATRERREWEEWKVRRTLNFEIAVEKCLCKWNRGGIWDFNWFLMRCDWLFASCFLVWLPFTFCYSSATLVNQNGSNVIFFFFLFLCVEVHTFVFGSNPIIIFNLLVLIFFLICSAKWKYLTE
jgi:hypothetical protein